MSSGVLLSCIVSWTARVLDQWGSSGGRLLVLKTAEEWWRKLEVVVTMSGGWYCICNHYWRLLMCVSKLMVLSRKTRGPQALDWRLHQVSTGGLHWLFEEMKTQIWLSNECMDMQIWESCCSSAVLSLVEEGNHGC